MPVDFSTFDVRNGPKSAEECSVRFLIDEKRNLLEEVLTYKDGAFKSKITGDMSVAQMLDVFISSDLTTEEEKKRLQIGKELLMPYAGEPWDVIQRRHMEYAWKVSPLFKGLLSPVDVDLGALPPVHILGKDGKPEYTWNPLGGAYAFTPANEDPGDLLSLEFTSGRLNITAGPDGVQPSFLSGNTVKERFLARKAAERKKRNTSSPVHPSAILVFPDLSDPSPDEVDNYPLVMSYILKEFQKQLKAYKDGAFKDRMKPTMKVAKTFKILIGSELTTPAEKEILRRGLEWVQYLENRFGGLVKLGRFHSILYNGVFEEKVFGIFRADEDRRVKEAGGKLQERLSFTWSMSIVFSDSNDYLLVGDDWDIKCVPKDTVDTGGFDMHRVKLTDEGGDLEAPDGKLKSLSLKDGQYSTALMPGKLRKLYAGKSQDTDDIDEDDRLDFGKVNDDTVLKIASPGRLEAVLAPDPSLETSASSR